MNKLLYRFVAASLAVLMLFAVLPFSLSAQEERQDLKSPFYNVSCKYDKKASKIRLEFRMKSEDVKKYSDCEIKLYALTASQMVNDISRLTPVVSGLKPSNRTGAEVKLDGLSDRLSYYIFSMHTPEGLICSDPIFPQVNSVGTELSFKGIETQSTTEVFESGAGTVVVDVDIDKLIGGGSGYLYPTSDYTYTFSSTYLHTIDRLMKLYRSDGRNMLLRLFSSSGKNTVSAETYAEQRAVYAYVSFLYSRYRSEEYGGINGIILGTAAVTTEQNAKSYANALYAAQSGLDDLGVSCPLIAPVSDIYEQSVAFLDAVSARSEQLGGLRFTVMVESACSPYGLDDGYFYEFLNGGEEFKSTLKPNDANSQRLSVENVTRLTRSFTKEYKATVYPNVIYNWQPNETVSGKAAAAAYAYSYYELYRRGNVDCFVISAKNDLDAAMPTVKYINTDLRKTYVDDEEMMRLFGVESWQTQFDRLNEEKLSEYSVIEKAVEKESLPSFRGTVDYFDFSSSSSLSGWYAGEACTGIFSDSGNGGKALNARLSFDGGAPNGAAFIVYNYKYSESFLFTDYIAIDLALEAKSAENIYSVTVTLGGNGFISEYTADGIVGGNSEKLYLDVRELDAADTVDYLRISVRQTGGEAEPAQLKLYSVTANSLQYNNRTLQEHIKEERERLKSDGSSDTFRVTVSALLFPMVILVLTAFVMITISRKSKRTKENDEQKQ